MAQACAPGRAGQGMKQRGNKMFMRISLLICVLMMVCSSGAMAQRERAEPYPHAKPTPKPSPTPTNPKKSGVGPSGGGTHATVEAKALAVASPTPKPSPTPTDPRLTPVGPKPGGPHALAKFEGTWTLDREKSGLSPSLQTKEVTWRIALREEEIVIDHGTKPDWGTPAAAAATTDAATTDTAKRQLGMWGSRIVRHQPAPSYRLDGRETTFNFGEGTVTLKLQWIGDTLELSRKTTPSGRDGKSTDVENLKLDLAEDGKVLRVKAHNEGVYGPTEMTLVFKKRSEVSP